MKSFIFCCDNKGRCCGFCFPNALGQKNGILQCQKANETIDTSELQQGSNRRQNDDGDVSPPEKRKRDDGVIRLWRQLWVSSKALYR
jgi:hypothetical protein